MVMDLAAKASLAGGEKLTNQTPEEARMNLALGYANLAIAGLDLGLATGLIGKVVRIPGAVRSAASLTRHQSQVWINSIAQHTGTLTDAALEKLLQGVKMADEKTTQIVLNGDGTLTQMRPLGQAADKLETTVAARASGKAKPPKDKDLTPAERLAKAKKNYRQTSNWNEIEPLIGKAVNKSTQLPPGYTFYEKPPNFFGKRELFILRENGADAAHVPLMIDEGKIQAGTSRLSRGRKAMDQNLTAAGVKVPKGYQRNHLIPDEVAQSNPLMVEMLKRDIYDVDRASNLLPMPGDAAVRKANPSLMGHQGSHGNYNRLVNDELNRVKTDLVQEYGSLNKVPDTELKSAIETVENRARKRILRNDSSIPTRIDPNTGTKVISDADLGDQELVG
jgi:hypothetical protein